MLPPECDAHAWLSVKFGHMLQLGRHTVQERQMSAGFLAAEQARRHASQQAEIP